MPCVSLALDFVLNQMVSFSEATLAPRIEGFPSWPGLLPCSSHLGRYGGPKMADVCTELLFLPIRNAGMLRCGGVTSSDAPTDLSTGFWL
ncbi:hypothetical protein EDB85DRAFT_280826 [Lactarius pseudohatsudake]|nr:hypothetical protein EDB85DRAFT_280826 [Lactarius pseudohatsudake]